MRAFFYTNYVNFISNVYRDNNDNGGILYYIWGRLRLLAHNFILIIRFFFSKIIIIITRSFVFNSVMTTNLSDLIFFLIFRVFFFDDKLKEIIIFFLKKFNFLFCFFFLNEVKIYSLCEWVSEWVNEPIHAYILY